ncbi:MAG TPA: baseplate J/gp47 family protein [Candidatus Limnocylindrales bacterium]|nr:baseplate J/gp47 family protein [Candidatus Limnocylindrales bacterium]
MSARAIEFVHLEPADDALTVRDRLAFLRGRRVALVWPEEGTALQRKLDLVLIQRAALRANIRLALVTHDTLVLRHAAELNMSAFETLRDAEHRRWKRGHSRAFTTRVKRPAGEVDPEDLMPYATRLKSGEPQTRLRRGLRLILRLALLLLLVVLVAGVGLLALPGATVMLLPGRDFMRTSAIITADPDLPATGIDVERGIIPATTYRAEIVERGTVPTSGTQTLSAAPARGTVVFINRTDAAVEIPAGTLVSTSAGTPSVFQTLSDIMVTAGVDEQAEAAIEAIPESTGDAGNVEAGLINTVVGELGDRVNVRNLAPTFGGETVQISTVTEADRDAVIAVLRQQLQNRAFNELPARASGSQFIIPDSIRIAEERSDWMTFDHAVGEQAESLTLTMRAIVAATAVDEELARQVAYARLTGEIPRGRSLLPNTLTFERGLLESLDASGRATFSVTASGAAEAAIDESALRNRLAGLPLDEALAYLNSDLDLQAGSTPSIRISPDWFGRMPLLAPRITVAEGSAPADLTP